MVIVMNRDKTSKGCLNRLRLHLAGWLLPLWVAVVAIACGQETFAGTLVKDGRASGSIVLPEGLEEGKSRVWTAARDLAGWIEQMSGAEIPLHRDNEVRTGFRILIGSTRLAPVKPQDVSEEKVGFDGFIIRSVPNGLVIAGRTPEGTRNGVNFFAEQVLGLHWYSLRKAGPTVPERRTITIARLDVTEKPDFAIRMQGGPIWMNYVTDRMKANYGKWAGFNRLGGPGGSFGHMLYGIVPDSLFETHPEYFALIDGKRTKGTHEVQRCLSNPGVVQLAIDHSRTMLARNPGNITSLSQNDGEGWCECAPCRAMGPTKAHQMLTFANKVAQANEERHPNGQYGILAYASSFDAPADMKGHKNVIPFICTYAAICRTHSIHSSCPSIVHKRKMIQEWARICGHFGTYSYSSGGPFSTPNILSLAEELRLYRDLGGTICRYHEQTAGPKSGWELAFWVETKLMWDVDLDLTKLRRQFIEGHYGKRCADAVEKVYIAVEDGVRGLPAGDWPVTSNYGHNMLPRIVVQPVFDANRDDVLTALSLMEKEPDEFFRRNVRRDMTILIEEFDWQKF